MARVRSPNYPTFSLAEAIRRVGPVFEKEHKHPMPKDVLAKNLGYGGVNGASLGAISAMLKYGLIEQEGDNYKVADRALAILFSQNDVEKAEAIHAAAFSPALFAELTEHFKGSPPSDDNLRAYLVRRGFAQSALAGVIQAFRETIELVPSNIGGITAKSTAAGGGDLQLNVKPGGAPAVSQQVTENVLRVSVNDDRLEVSAALLDQQGVDRLIRVLEANKQLLPAATSAKAEPTSGGAN